MRSCSLSGTELQRTLERVLDSREIVEINCEAQIIIEIMSDISQIPSSQLFEHEESQ